MRAAMFHITSIYNGILLMAAAAIDTAHAHFGGVEDCLIKRAKMQKGLLIYSYLYMAYTFIIDRSR